MAFLSKVTDDYLRNPVVSSKFSYTTKKGKNINVAIKDSDFTSADTYFDVKYANVHLVTDTVDSDLYDLTDPLIKTDLEDDGIHHLLYRGSLYGLATVVSASGGSTTFHSVSTIKGETGTYNKFVVKGCWYDSVPSQLLTVNAGVTLQLWSSPGEKYGLINKDAITCKATGAEIEVHEGFQIASTLTLSDGSTAGTLTIFEGALISSEIALGTTATSVYFKGSKFNLKVSGDFKGGHPKADTITHDGFTFSGSSVNLYIYHDETMEDSAVADLWNILSDAKSRTTSPLTGTYHFQTGSKLDTYDLTKASTDQITSH